MGIYLNSLNAFTLYKNETAKPYFSGTGYADFIFYPKDQNADCIILELKVDHTPEEAIKQIKEKKYMLRFQGKLAEQKNTPGGFF